jgi:hypothetical protein
VREYKGSLHTGTAKTETGQNEVANTEEGVQSSWFQAFGDTVYSAVFKT